MAGVKLRDDEWQPLYDAQDARDWIFPIEALAFGDRDDDFTEWVDSEEKRAEPDRRAAGRRGADLPLLAGAPQAAKERSAAARRGTTPDLTRKNRQRLH